MKEVSAGGAVFLRQDGRVRLLMIQDRYGKWTLPKGKREEGESLEVTALREIREETGIAGRVIQPLETIRYQFVHPEKGTVDKEVHFFLVETLEGETRAQREEIQGVEWLEPVEAWRRHLQQGYDNNHSVLLKAFQALNLPIPNESFPQEG